MYMHLGWNIDKINKCLKHIKSPHEFRTTLRWAITTCIHLLEGFGILGMAILLLNSCSQWSHALGLCVPALQIRWLTLQLVSVHNHYLWPPGTYVLLMSFSTCSISLHPSFTTSSCAQLICILLCSICASLWVHGALCGATQHLGLKTWMDISEGTVMGHAMSCLSLSTQFISNRCFP